MAHDSPEAQEYRAKMVDHLRESGRLPDPVLAEVFAAVPRHVFVPERPLDEAYADRALGTKKVDDQVLSSISQPTMIAIMLAQLDLQPGHRVLEIGAGTGYQAALMARLVGPGGHVVTMDIDEDIVANAQHNLAATGVDNVSVRCSDGSDGHAAGGPYDRIVLTVAAADIAPAWWRQLRPGGLLLLPLQLRLRAWQQCTVLRWQDDHFRSLSVSGCRFIQLRGELALPELDFVDLDPEATIQILGPPPLAPDILLNWLAAPAGCQDTGVQIEFGPALMALNFWLSLHEPDLAYFSGSDAAAMPVLYQLGSGERTRYTYALIGEQGLAAVSQPPGAAQTQDRHTQLESFNLHLCQGGADDRPLRRLRELVRAWDDAGQPRYRDLDIRAYPQPAPAGMTADFIIDRKYMRFVLNWRRR